MERKETKGALALSGKEWKCYTDSTTTDVKELNKELTDQEVQTVFEIVQSINKELEEYENYKETSGITE